MEEKKRVCSVYALLLLYVFLLNAPALLGSLFRYSYLQNEAVNIPIKQKSRIVQHTFSPTQTVKTLSTQSKLPRSTYNGNSANGFTPQLIPGKHVLAQWVVIRPKLVYECDQLIGRAPPRNFI